MTVIRQAAILAGGLGSRLGSLTDKIPKPMIQVGNRPFLDHILERLVKAGIKEILILSGYLSQVIREHYDSNTFNGVPITCVEEPELMGTGGALRYAAPYLQGQFMLVNGDTLFDIDLPLFMGNQPKGQWLAYLALRQLSDTGRSGVVELEKNHITVFKERGEDGKAGLTNGGLYLLNKKIIDLIPMGNCSLESTIFPQLARDGTAFGHAYEGYFIDIGVPEDLEKARQDLGRGR